MPMFGSWPNGRFPQQGYSWKTLEKLKEYFLGAWAFGDHEHENDMKLRASLQSEELCPGQESGSI